MNDEERPEFNSRVICILNCTAGNWDHPDGESATIITTASPKTGDVTAFSLSQRDTRFLAVRLLVALATNDEKFAQKLLDDLFPADEEGNFIWPNGIEFGS